MILGTLTAYSVLKYGNCQAFNHLVLLVDLPNTLNGKCITMGIALWASVYSGSEAFCWRMLSPINFPILKKITGTHPEKDCDAQQYYIIRSAGDNRRIIEPTVEHRGNLQLLVSAFVPPLNFSLAPQQQCNGLKIGRTRFLDIIENGDIGINSVKFIFDKSNKKKNF